MKDGSTDPLSESPPISAATRILVVLLFVLFIGGIVVGVLLLRTLVPTVKADTVAAAERLDEFGIRGLPERFAPVATLDWTMLYLIPMTGVWVEADGGESVISVVRLEGAMAEQESVRKRAIEALKDQAIGAGTVEKTETLSDVAGQDVTVLVVRETSGDRYRVVSHNREVNGQLFLIEYKTPDGEFEPDKVRSLFKTLAPRP